MALSWTQDRLGPMCRYAEDCAIVLHAAAQPDNRDMSVSDIPFNWDAQLNIRKLRIGYIQQSFDDIANPVSKAAAYKVLDTLKSLGVRQFIPLEIPEWPYDGSAINVESAVFFDELVRTGGVSRMTNPGRATAFKNARLVPAVEYLQSQRARMMMMTKLAEATAGVDVYLVASNGNNGGGGRGARGAGADESSAPAAAPRGGRGRGGGPAAPQSPAQRHSTFANLACYPAVNVVPGFSEAATPLSMTFFARPFGESALLAVARAYQDASGHHRKHPELA
jgi:Asp-tRNA(Asn)/Glu-tRNA(Gln) amidotransferase A subunit family amidase